MDATTDTFVIERVFEASREEVFRAWTVPEEIAVWYGPEQFDTPAEKVRVDLRVGGRWEATMVQRGSGAEFPASYEIVELVEPELLVLRSDPMPEHGMPDPTVTRVELREDGPGRTRMTLTDGPYPTNAGHAEAGWTQSFEKLGAALSARR